MSAQTRRYVFAAVRAGWGAALVLRPDQVVRTASGQSPTTASRAVARILGIRHLAQAAATLHWHSRTARDLGLATDLLHAGTGLGLAVLSTRWRRGALIDASLATAFAATSAGLPR